MFKYEATARSRALPHFLISGIFLGILGWMAFALHDAPVWVWIVPGLIGGVVGLIMLGVLWQGVGLLFSDKSWLIELDARSLRWQSPNEKVDRSFEYALSDISKVVTYVHNTQKGRSVKRYVLELDNGQPIRLSPNSGVVLSELAEALVAQGVASDNRRGFKGMPSRRQAKPTLEGNANRRKNI